ncbi:glycosyltransferase family 2 protein [bacterium]|nr:glycosyltransferase family 2 protein [bacterium]
MKQTIVALIPAYNEAGKTNRVVARFSKGMVDEIVVIDDGSTDNTASQVKKKGATVLKHKERKGIGAALRTGMDYALKNNFDIIVVLAGNGKDNPEEIPRLLEPILKEDYDFVQGSRYIKGGFRGKMPTHRLLFTRMYSWAVRITTGFPITDATNGFRAYKTSILKDKRIDIHQDWLRESLEYYLTLKVLKLKFRAREVPVSKVYPRGATYKAYTKIKPFTGWWERLKPLIYLTPGIRR